MRVIIKYKIKIAVMSSLIFSVNSFSQIIFRQDQPVIQPVWHHVAVFSPSQRSVAATEFSQDGKLIVSTSKFRNYLMLRRVADGELLWKKMMDVEVECVVFSPDEKYFTAGDEAYMVTIFDNKGTLVKSFEHDAVHDVVKHTDECRLSGTVE